MSAKSSFWNLFDYNNPLYFLTNHKVAKVIEIKIRSQTLFATAENTFSLKSIIINF